MDRASRLKAHGSLLIAHSSQPNHTLYSLYLLYPLDFCPLPFVVRLRSTSEASAVAGGLRRNYGFMESRIDGIMELWNYGTTERASRLMAHGSWLTAQSHSLLSLPSIPFRLLPLVFRQRSVSEAITSGLKRSIGGDVASPTANPSLSIPL